MSPGLPFFLWLLMNAAPLDEHATGATRGIKDAPVKGLYNLNDEFDERSRREEFTAALPLAHGEIAEEVLINLPESIPFNVHRDLFHDTEEFKECALFQTIVRLR